ncbi:MAG: efflux RND transporter permease subunit [Roseibacillus sp.]
MFSKLVTFALSNRLLVFVLTAVLCLLGWRAFKALPIDAFPDITTTQVQVIVKAPGMTPEEVEQRVTQPLEIEIRGIPDQTVLRSMTKYGLCVITTDFTDETDLDWARQQVNQRIAQVLADLPEGVEGGLGPVTTPLSEAYMFLVEGEGHTRAELRGYLDWMIRPRLLSLPGVADVNALGGDVRSVLVEPRPEALRTFGFTHTDLVEAIERNNANAGGGNILQNDSVLLLTTDARLHGEKDISQLTVGKRDGVAVKVRDLAEIRIDRMPRFGGVTANGKGEAIQGIVLTRRGANSRETINSAKERLEEIKPSLPEGVTVRAFYDRTQLIETATSTVNTALLQSIVIVLVVLGLFLFDIRSAITAGLILPLTVLGAFFIMQQVGLSANLMSLGGIVVAIGILVDSAVVMVENIQTNVRGKTGHDRAAALRDAAVEMAKPIVSGVIIIIVSLAPVLSLRGMEGKLFGPLALTIAISLLVSLVLSLTAIPMLATLFMKGREGMESPLARFLLFLYRPLLRFCLRFRALVALIAIGLLLLSVWLGSRTGREFLPQLNEGTIVLQFEKIPSISLERSMAIDDQIARDLMALPEVIGVYNRTGSDELRLDPMGLNETDCFLETKPRSEWLDSDPASLEEKIRVILARYPGVVSGFTQPIDMRVSEMLSGVTSAVAIKLTGPELTGLEELSARIEGVVAKVPGAIDVARTPLTGQLYYQVDLNHEMLSRTGIEPEAVNTLVSEAIGGAMATELIEGVRRIPVIVRYPEASRNGPNSLGQLTLQSPSGEAVPLSTVASIQEIDGPSAIDREDAERMIVIESNVAGRDVVGFVDEMRAAIEQEVSLPHGYRLEFGGQFENEARAGKSLMVIVPAVLLVIFLILYTTFQNMRQAVLILLNIPFALIGGVFALFLSGFYLSVPASIGFIALLGMAVMNGVVLVSYLNQLREESDLGIEEAAFAGAQRRFRPVMMTALLTIVGLIPILFATGPGSEIQKPLAVVVVGGTLTSTALTLLLLPALYASLESLVARRSLRREAV